MMRTFGWLLLCLCVFAGIGYYLGWFSFSASLNKDKFKEDMNAVKEKVQNAAGNKSVEGTIHQIGPAGQELTIRDSKNQDVTVKVDADTKIKIGGTDSPFSGLKADDSVSVTYEVNKDGNAARTITVPKKS